MKYSHIIEQFTWSYSRIGSFEMCPYKFFLTYIRKTPGERQFFSDYGSFMHKIIERYLKGELSRRQLAGYYLKNFRQNVIGRAPSKEIFGRYFNDGLQYFRTIDFPFLSPLGVEKKVEFFIDKSPFVGVIDCVAEDDDGLVILDNKSRTLKQRSVRKKPTKSDEELDHYLRQLYLYSIPAKELYGEYPSKLVFNCFRSRELIVEPFHETAMQEAVDWAKKSIQNIQNNENWEPSLNYFVCKNLCDRNRECEYYQMNRG